MTSRLLLVPLLALLPVTGAAAVEPPLELTLDAAVDRAQGQALELFRARTDVLLADVDKVRALAPVLPRVDLSLGAGYVALVRPIYPNPIDRSMEIEGPTATQAAFSLQLSATQLIYDGGRWWTVIAQAGDLERSAKAALRAVQNDVRFGVAQRFYALEKAARALAAMDAQLGVDQQQLERVRALLAAGAGKQADVAVVERNLAEDRIKRASLDFAVVDARRQLNLALGDAPDQPTRLVLGVDLGDAVSSVPALVLPERVQAVAGAQGRRPEVERSLAALEAQKKAVDVERAALFPTVALGASYAKSSQRPANVFGLPTENFQAQLGLSLTWNLFQGRGTQTAIEKSELELSRSEATHASLLRNVAGEVDAALEGVRLQLEVLRLNSDAMAAAEEAVRLARGLFEQGKGTLLELRDAELRLLQAKINATTVRLDLEVAREALRRALGGEELEQGGRR